ncbi:MAG: HEPN domain-containing protein [Nitrospirae bacterium]|nr:MAG: HEPN domain-containing protein [Nitrospirota bacterium]
MTLSVEEKQVLSKYRLEKSENMLEEAIFNFEHGKYATSVNRAYYAVLNSARALLILKGIDPQTHTGCKTMLSLHLIRTGLMNERVIEDFKVLFSRRTDVDYGDFETIDRKRAEDSIKRARRFLKEALKAYKKLLQVA